MSVIKSAGAGESGGFAYNSVATQSLRFNDDSNDYLSKTETGGSGNQKTWTYSFWFKHGSRTSIFDFLTANASGDKYFEFSMSAAQKLTFYYHDSTLLLTTQILRDRSAWYHIAVVHDTTQDDAEDRLKIYINGIKLTASDYDTNILNDTNLPEDFDGGVNETGVEHLIGRNQVGNNDLDGYLSDVYLLDGTAVGDTNGVLNEFIEIKNGICIPKEYSGSYGTHGFHFEFKQTGTGTASTSTIGADTSGQTNHYTSNGLDAYDSAMPDSPENNFATLNPLDVTSATLSEGNLKIVSPGNIGANATYKMSSGKWYAEFYIDNSGSRTVDAHVVVGDINYVANFTGTVGSFVYYNAAGNLNGTTGKATFTTGDIIAVAIDADNGTVAFYNDNSLQGTVSSLSYDAYCPSITNFNGSGAFAVANFGQDGSFAGTLTGGAIGSATDGNGHGKFKYAPPSGFLALCTANLEEPTIGPNSTTQADDHFNTVLFSGNGSGASVTGVGFQPDWIWAKNRTNSYSHELWDSSRGVNSDLQSDNANPEITDVNRLVSFDSDGFSYGASSNLYVNSTNSVAWNWKANGGTTSTISVGDVSSGVPSIASTVQVNATAGFSIVTFTGNGSDDATIGHGLGTTPAMIITKNRDETQQWRVHHKDLSQYYVLYLAEDYAQIATNGSSNGYIKTVGDDTYSTHASNVDSLGVNGSSDKMVSYCFAEIEGYSKFGSYTGNGSTDGTFVYTGFRPAWVMVKRTDSADNWFIHDSTRDTVNPNAHLIYADIPNNEYDATGDADNSPHDFTSNGFKFRSSNANWNGDGAAYIYMAFAEAPFKYANAR